ncbi:hypothetical protein MRO49_25210, partial [Escherichia coli]|nr:hypothetical protein [Escherichia coli]
MSKKKSFNINELDYNNIGAWPQQAKLVFCVLVGLFILVMAWFLLIKGRSEELAGLERQEADLRREFEDK